MRFGRPVAADALRNGAASEAAMSARRERFTTAPEASC